MFAAVKHRSYPSPRRFRTHITSASDWAVVREHRRSFPPYPPSHSWPQPRPRSPRSPWRTQRTRRREHRRQRTRFRPLCLPCRARTRLYVTATTNRWKFERFNEGNRKSKFLVTISSARCAQRYLLTIAIAATTATSEPSTIEIARHVAERELRARRRPPLLPLLLLLLLPPPPPPRLRAPSSPWCMTSRAVTDLCAFTVS